MTYDMMNTLFGKDTTSAVTYHYLNRRLPRHGFRMLYDTHTSHANLIS